MKYLFITIITLILTSTTSVAQNNLLFDGKKNKIGFVYSFGGQNLAQFVSQLNQEQRVKVNDFFIKKGINPDDTGLAVAYKYNVLSFQLQYYYSLLRKESWGIEILFEPQYNSTKFRLKDNAVEEINSYEYGLNVGALIRKNFLSDQFSIYVCISAGPHYVSEAPDRQRAGFIFSDNFFGGANVKLFKGFYLDTRVGFRHLSNAGIKHPNRGINTIMLGGGVFCTF